MRKNKTTTPCPAGVPPTSPAEGAIQDTHPDSKRCNRAYNLEGKQLSKQDHIERRKTAKACPRANTGYQIGCMKNMGIMLKRGIFSAFQEFSSAALLPHGWSLNWGSICEGAWQPPATSEGELESGFLHTVRSLTLWSWSEDLSWALGPPFCSLITGCPA